MFRFWRSGLTETEKTLKSAETERGFRAAGAAAEAGFAAELVVPRPDDFHVHLRQGPQAALYARRHAAVFGRALIMPNTVSPVADAPSVARYRAEIMGALPKGAEFLPLMTFKLLPGMSARSVEACAAAGAIAGKYYPAGSTTNAADGPASPDSVAEALAAMEEADIVLCLHGEDAEAPALERERVFLDTVEEILSRWPRLRVVLEHLSTKEAVDFVASGPARLGATVTAHHLLFTIDDMLGAGLNPHLFCKPLIKGDKDRAALRQAVFSASPRFFFGSDSAPHARAAKESGFAPAGVYSSPAAIPALAGLFEAQGALGAFKPFVAGSGARFYRLPPPAGTLKLRRETWQLPAEIDGVVPMCAGSKLAWRLVV